MGDSVGFSDNDGDSDLVCAQELVGAKDGVTVIVGAFVGSLDVVGVDEVVGSRDGCSDETAVGAPDFVGAEEGDNEGAFESAWQ